MDACRELWTTKDKDLKIYAAYFAVIQGSMMGKTRLFFHLAEHDVFVFYICLRRAEETGFPQSISILQKALTDPSHTEGYYAAFLLTALEKLKVFKQGNRSCRLWLTQQQDPNWWNDILGSFISIPISYSLSWYFSDLSHLACSEKSLAMSKETAFIPPRIMTQDSEAEYRSGLNKIFADNLGASETDSIAFIFDEARALLSADLHKLTSDDNFVSLRRAFTYFPCNEEYRTPVAIMTDTTAKISNLAPTKLREPSLRVSRLPNTLFPPFYLLANVDVWVENAPKTLSDMCNYKYYCQYGRPQWGALAKQVKSGGLTIEDLMHLAQIKIKGSDSKLFDGAKLEACEAIAILGVRICLDVVPQCQISHDLVAQNMRTLLYIAPDRESIISGYFSEPVLVQAAAQVTNSRDSNRRWSMLLEQLIFCMRNGMVDAGFSGELVARILLLLAWDKCFTGNNVLASGTVLQAVHLMKYLDILLDLDEETQAALRSEFNSSQKTAWVRCTHFVKIDYVPTVCQLLSLFRRGAAVIAKELKEGVDLFLPIVFCEDTDSEILDSMVSGVFVQVKNRKDTGDSGFPDTATTHLTPTATGFEIGDGLPFLSLYMNLGARVEPRITMPDVITHATRPDGSNEAQRQIRLSVFSISQVVYKVLKDDEHGIAKSLSQIAKNWVDPVVLHQENGVQSCCMVRSMLPCQYKAVNDHAAGPVSVGGEVPELAAACGGASGGGRKRPAPEKGQAGFLSTPNLLPAFPSPPNPAEFIHFARMILHSNHGRCPFLGKCGRVQARSEHRSRAKHSQPDEIKADVQVHVPRPPPPPPPPLFKLVNTAAYLHQRLTTHGMYSDTRPVTRIATGLWTRA
jgi:hypothetical protein